MHVNLLIYSCILNVSLPSSSVNSCRYLHSCNHVCNGVINETENLPCLEPDCINHKNSDIKDDKYTDCSICYTDVLSTLPSILLECGHCFHFKCCERMLKAKWHEMKISFNFRNCPLCRKPMKHKSLEYLNNGIIELYNKTKKKALMRLQYEKLVNHDEIIK